MSHAVDRRLGLVISGFYPCIRASKITLALQRCGWDHDSLSPCRPPHLNEAYRRMWYPPMLDAEGMTRLIADHPAEVLHVHNEPNWPAIAARRAARGRPVVLDVHDVTLARKGPGYDTTEAPAYEAADGFVFVAEEQRDFAVANGLDVEGKPYAIVPNHAVGSAYVERTPLPHVGGVVHQGRTARRGALERDLDLSEVADALGGELHIYSGTGLPDYGRAHTPCRSYRILLHRLAQHDWGLVGSLEPDTGWLHTWPNKVFDYLAAGIPFISLNLPLLDPLCDVGLGVSCATAEDVREASRLDPTPFRAEVLARRADYTMESVIGRVGSLYEQLLEA